MNDAAFDELLFKHLDGTLGEDEARPLSERLASDPQAARRLALFAADYANLRQALRVQEISRKAIALAPLAARPPAAHPAPAVRAGFSWKFKAAAGLAAAVVLAVGLAFALRAPSAALLSGRILVDGQPSTTLAVGKPIQAVGGSAVLRLEDGSRLELSEESTVRLTPPADGFRQWVALDEGEGRFQVVKGGGQFRVQTPIGHVTVLGTEFSVRVPRRHEAARAELAVAVHEGRVQVDHNGRSIMLVAGQTFTGDAAAQVARVEPLHGEAPALPGRARELEKKSIEGEDDLIEITGILHAVYGENAEGEPEFITITAADATVYNLDVNAPSVALAREFEGQEVTVSGTRHTVNGIDWFSMPMPNDPPFAAPFRRDGTRPVRPPVPNDLRRRPDPRMLERDGVIRPRRPEAKTTKERPELED